MRPSRLLGFGSSLRSAAIPFFALLAPFVSGPVPGGAQASPHLRQAAARDVDFPEHFRVFTGQGEPASMDDIVAALDEVDALLVGETHTDPVGHWIEDRLFSEALARFGETAEPGAVRKVALSMEFFERDVQPVVNEYLAGLITESQFIDDARAVTYYREDYRPLVERARDAGAPVIASNAPRRYVNRVSRLGRDALRDLSPWALSFLPPLPYPPPSDAYREEWTTLMREMPMVPRCDPPPGLEEAGPEEDEPEPPPHGVTPPPLREHPPVGDSARDRREGGPPHEMPSHAMGDFMENGLQAQALWDAAMARAVTSFLDLNPEALVVHVVGGFHVENHTGVPEKVEYYRPGTRTLVVAMEVVEDFRTFNAEEHAGLGDFVILTDQALDKNYERNCMGVR